MNTTAGRVDAPKFLNGANDINRLRGVLRKSPRDLLFFELAIRTGMHAKDLLKLTVADLDGLKPGQELKLRRIPKASNRIVITPAVQRAFASRVRQASLSGDDFLFRSQKGGRPLSLVSLSRLVSGWFAAAGMWSGPFPGMTCKTAFIKRATIMKTFSGIRVKNSMALLSELG